MAAESKSEQRRDVKAARVNVKLVLAFTEGLFRHRKTLTDGAWEKALDSGKKILRKSQREPETRLFLGTSPDVWTDFTSCFSQALPVLEQQSFATQEPPSVDCNGSSSALMALNHATLLKDLERLNDLLTIARNMLATTLKAQNLAADAGFDQQILKYIDVCVRVTARGYDGEAGGRTETQWANVVGAYKKLLITCLQFLHNLVMHNEHRKLLLWLDLFGNSRSSDPHSLGNSQLQQNGIHKPVLPPEGFTGSEGFTGEGDVARRARMGFPTVDDLNLALTALGATGRPTGAFEPDEAARLASEVIKTVRGLVDQTLGQKRLVAGSSDQDIDRVHRTQFPENTTLDRSQKQPWNLVNLPDSMLYSDPRGTEIQEDDMKIGRTPQSAAETLREAKHQLMSRLHDSSAFPLEGEEQDGEVNYENGEEQQGSDDADVQGSDVAADGSVEEEEEEEDEEEDDEDDEEDDEYHGPGDQERGLLTDIPLVLGPQEIEALPMIIQAGIFNGRNPKNVAEAKEMQNMQAVRCNILLAQEAGRNLLRELLIFIAAWDLQEDEFYFKLMMQIMEAILQNGLMPFAYQTFGEVKDIVSPAQSIVIKILTQIFRKKQGLPPLTGAEGTAQLVFAPAPSASGQVPRREAPTRVDLLVVRYIFTVFRQSIIPETCALIYLQGQIRVGVAMPEDFPLNLWDMERVYEGVYQFLEFFAVLTESDVWKELLVKWEIVSELVTLLRELDASIPKAPLGPIAQTVAKAEGAAEGVGADQNSTPGSVAVERPYDPVSGDGAFPPSEYPPASASEAPSQGLDNQDPSEFEWRNLKKLVVLVLSSLVWKSVVVQNQIRQYGGVEMVLSCCNFDANNPYIREHAIMCLRFLLECNKENQEIVEQLEARKAVPNEVLHKKGYETYIDEAGKVGLRKMEGAVAVAQT